MAVGSNLTYLGGKGGVVEIWSREKHNKIDTLQIGRNCKVVCMSLNEREDVLVIGTSDGRIQVECFFYFRSLLLYQKLKTPQSYYHSKFDSTTFSFCNIS